MTEGHDDSCKTVHNNKSIGSGTYDLSNAVPLDKFTSAELIELNGATEGKQYQLRDLLHDNGSIILVVRRPGKEALDISKLLDQLQSKPSLIAIVHENIPGEIDGFAPYWPGGKIYLDKNRSMYKAFGNRKLSIWQLLSWSSIVGVYKQAWGDIKSGRIKGNLSVGNGFHLGGVIVVGNSSQGMLYQWKQEYETLANTDEILKAAQSIKSNL